MSRQYFDESLSRKAPVNYERYFTPAIGKPLAEDLVEAADIRSGDKILDVACGTGIVARLAAQKTGPEGSVSGLDANAGMLAVARSTPSGENQPIEWYEAGAEAIPLPDDTFDLVFCQLGLQFMEDKVVALKEMRRVLKPGGRILFNLPGPVAPVFEIVAGAMKRHIGDQAAGFVMHVFSLHDTGQIEGLMREAGFGDLKVSAESKLLKLPGGGAFLWQYVYGTPLSAIVSEAGESSLQELESEVVKGWEAFTVNGTIRYEQRVVTAIGRK